MLRFPVLCRLGRVAAKAQLVAALEWHEAVG